MEKLEEAETKVRLSIKGTIVTVSVLVSRITISYKWTESLFMSASLVLPTSQQRCVNFI
jgi:hypothetical protein